MNSSLASVIADSKAIVPELVAASGEISKKYFRTELGVDTKSDASPVTIADKLAEQALRKIIQQHFPEHGIIGEEFGTHQPEADFQWYLDPIDGTKSFIAGFFDFGTLIGLTYKNQPVLGIIHQPILDELYIGDNQQTTLNGKVIKTRSPQSLAEATLLTTDLFTVAKLHDPAGFDRLTRSVKYCRTWGNCYGYALVAAGYVDVMVDPILGGPWDIVALIPIIRGAGGVITDYYGTEPSHESKRHLIAASSKQLHSEVLKVLHG